MSGLPYKVKAVFEYSSAHDDDLSFPNGQVITVTEEEGDDWYIGEYTDAKGGQHSGLFPKNFVERYEPEIPTRPVRQQRPKSTIQSSPLQPASSGGQEDTPVSPIVPVQTKQAVAPAPTPTAEPVAKHDETEQVLPAKEEARTAPVEDTPPKPKPGGAASSKGPPPPVAGKPNAFKDRIAAFNRQEDKPVLPFKPTGPGSNYTIKKPFVAPPPSRDAYVPTHKQEPAAKVYRREEDPEIAERIAEDQAAAENAGLASSTDAPAREGDDDEDAPKPQSLKDRIALLQKQQAEQAQKRADSASKEKPKRPAKKRTDSSEQAPIHESSMDSEQSAPVRASMDSIDPPRPALTRILSPPMSPIMREPDVMSDGNEADQSAADETTEANEDTSDQETDHERRSSVVEANRVPRAAAAPSQEPDVGDEEGTTEGQSEEEEEMDAETRRRLELRERMAKISGGMGMAGMFGPQPGLAVVPPVRKNSKKKERDEPQESPISPPPRPMIPVPGMFSPKAESRTVDDEPADESTGAPPVVPDAQDIRPTSKEGKSVEGRGAPPPVPGDRPVPVPVPPPASSRPMPPAPPSRVPMSPGADSGPPQRRRPSVETPRAGPPPIPGNRRSIETPRSPTANRGSSYFGSDAQSETSMPGGPGSPSIRAVPPPIPGMPAVSPLQTRPPPPPPPAASGQPVEEADEEESEYEGDYDTDIASGEKHKAALKTHARSPSFDESTTADDSPAFQTLPPPIPLASPPMTHRGAPPPLPDSAARGKSSSDIPRGAPPPIPTSRPPTSDSQGGNQRYESASRAAPPPPPTAAAPPPLPPVQQGGAEDSSDDELYRAPTQKSIDDSRAAPPPPTEPPHATQDASRLGARTSTDARGPSFRKSMDASRGSGEHYIASDVDLAEKSQWWAHPNTPPPSLQNRNDVLYEMEESSTSKRGGKTTISKDVYVLYMDYSQSTITARFDKSDPSDVVLEQRHEAPPPRMRQDQLETAWQTYGAKIAERASPLANSKKEVPVTGDGSPFALASELIRGLSSALQPIGTRAYGAPVYANIGNASVQQFDEIRPGDMITFRNARLQGKQGGLHSKYSLDVGSGNGHVAVVTEWDGTKKKVRALEQGKDDKGRTKVKVESYRLGDLKSGEVRVWRVVGREWVGWDGGK